MQLGTIIYILYLLIGAYVCLIAARVLVSWLRPRPGSSPLGRTFGAFDSAIVRNRR